MKNTDSGGIYTHLQPKLDGSKLSYQVFLKDLSSYWIPVLPPTAALDPQHFWQEVAQLFHTYGLLSYGSLQLKCDGTLARDSC